MPIAFYAHKQVFDQLHSRMQAQGITMTVYVDDLTLSGQQLMRLHLCPVRKAFRAVGLTCHKTSAFGKDKPKLVTGSVITEDGMRLPNKRHLKIAEGFRLLETAPSQDDLKVARTRLLGRINEAAAVDERYKRRLRGLRSLTERIAARTSERLGASPQYAGARISRDPAGPGVQDRS